MNKNITIFDYSERAVNIEILDFENVISATCNVISGDEVLTIKYRDGTEKIFDPYPNGRLHNYYDGCVNIPLDKIDDLNKFSNSYDMLEYFGDSNAKIRVGIEAFGDLLDLINGEDL